MYIRRRLLLGTIFKKLTVSNTGKQQPAKLLLPLLREDAAPDLGKIAAKTNHFRGFLCPEALSGAKIGNGFQQICLSLGIVTHDQVHTRIKIQA